MILGGWGAVNGEPHFILLEGVYPFEDHELKPCHVHCAGAALILSRLEWARIVKNIMRAKETALCPTKMLRRGLILCLLEYCGALLSRWSVEKTRLRSQCVR